METSPQGSSQHGIWLSLEQARERARGCLQGGSQGCCVTNKKYVFGLWFLTQSSQIPGNFLVGETATFCSFKATLGSP